MTVGRRQKSTQPRTTYVNTSYDAMFKSLQELANKDPKEAPRMFDQMTSSHFFHPMFEVLLDRKNENALCLEEDFEHNEEYDKVDKMLEEYFKMAEEGGPRDGDEDDAARCGHADIEEDYKRRMDALKSSYETSKVELKQNCEEAKRKLVETMTKHQSLRPITEQDKLRGMRMIEQRFQRAEYEVKQLTCNRAMLLNNSCLDARRKRRNFSKEATGILQEFFNDHADHPYPTDEQKAELADKCGITVQQVSNWFGNRRIRQKKTPASRTPFEAPPSVFHSEVVTVGSGTIHPADPNLLLRTVTVPIDPTYPASYIFEGHVTDPSRQISCVYGSTMGDLYQ